MNLHVVLVGLPGAGKSEVGRRVAGILNTEFVDVDELIERDRSMSIADIFARYGEDAFRKIEREAVARILRNSPSVLAPGGGWAVQPGNLASLRGRALSLYLRTSPETAAGRLIPDAERPLLQEGSPLERVRNLLRRREPCYEASDGVVDTDGKDPEQVAAEVVALARTDAGW